MLIAAAATADGRIAVAGPPPRASDARSSEASTDSLTFDYLSGGVHVIQRLTPGNDVVVVRLCLLGGVMELTPTTAGVEELALRASQYGSARYPGDKSRAAFSRTGSIWQVGSGTDWSTVGFAGITEGFDSTWAVFADRIVQPSLDSGSIALVRARMTKEVRLKTLTPEFVAHVTADSIMFVGHPYGLQPAGTESSLAGLTPDVVRGYVRSHFVTSRMLLVVVGNIPRARLERLVASTLGTLPPGSYVRILPPDAPHHPTSLAIIGRPSATNYILGYFIGPSVASRDYLPFELATTLLSSRISSAIRGRTGLSYAAGAPYEGREISVGGVYASSSLPGLVFALMRQQLDLSKTQQIPGWALQNYEKAFRAEFLQENETNESQAGALLRAQIYYSDYREAGVELKRLREVGPDDVMRAAKTYMRDIQFVYVGDTTLVRATFIRSM